MGDSFFSYPVPPGRPHQPGIVLSCGLGGDGLDIALEAIQKSLGIFESQVDCRRVPPGWNSGFLGGQSKFRGFEVLGQMAQLGKFLYNRQGCQLPEAIEVVKVYSLPFSLTAPATLATRPSLSRSNS